MSDSTKKVFAYHCAVFFEGELKILAVARKLQEKFIHVFDNEPQINPLPQDVPKEIPRCIFNDEKGNVLTLAGNRIDFDSRLFSNWENDVSITIYNLIQILKEENVNIERLGIVVQADCENSEIEELDTKVLIEKFKQSGEKNLSFLYKNNDMNFITSFIINENDIEHPRVFVLDVNTYKENKIYLSGKDPIDLVDRLIVGIKENLDDVF